MNEYLMIAIMAVSGILFSLGGTGYKWARRFVLPFFLYMMAILVGFDGWMSVCMGLSLIVAFSLGYGSRTAYWLKAIVFASYGASFIWLGFSWWEVILPCYCFICFVLSNWKPTSQIMFWKAWEFLTGVLVGICFISLR